MTEPLLSVKGLTKHYPINSGLLNRRVGEVKAVENVSFDIYPGETLGVVGESGCGKSTVAMSILRVEEPTAGEVIFNGGDRPPAQGDPDGTHPNDVTAFDESELKRFRRSAQMIFQDPSSSFNPRMKIGSSIAELLLVHGVEDRRRRRAVVENLLERVNLSAEDYDRYPHEFSGGQKQRIALARALVLNPELIVADEPVSALDASVQAEVLSLIDELQDEFGLSLLFISHDMAIVREICDRVAVMYLGEIVEIGETETVFSNPKHPYTEALLSSIPTVDPREQRESIELRRTVPDPADPPSGCRFHTRCHRVLQPDGVELDQAVWRRVLDFRDHVVTGDIDHEAVRKRLRTKESPGTDDTQNIENLSEPAAVDSAGDFAEIRELYELPADIPDSDLDEAVDATIEALLSGENDRAAKIIGTNVETPCEKTVPETTAHGSEHYAACIRHRPEYEGFSSQ